MTPISTDLVYILVQKIMEPIADLERGQFYNFNMHEIH